MSEAPKFIKGCWKPCPICDEASPWCIVHNRHVEDCPCPPVAEWERAGVVPFGQWDDEELD